MPTVKVLVVGGGGSGGYSVSGNAYSGAGGGAGGYVYDAAFAVTPQAYTVTVGAGGAASTSTRNNGQDSVFDSITATGGGAGGFGSLTSNAGNNGGSGGGSSNNGTAGVGSQGNNGGTGSAAFGASGSGGGSGAAGTADTNTNGRPGGAGTSNSISGSAVTYAGGGGSGGYQSGTAGAGGSGGGGAGGSGRSTGGAATNGTANTGGGGGGAGSGPSGGPTAGGAGGSGIVIIAYTTADFGTCTGGTITTSGSETIHTFTSSGTFTVVAAVVTVTAKQLSALGVGGSAERVFPTLLRNIVAYWKLDTDNTESVSGIAMTDLNTTYGTGKVGGCATWAGNGAISANSDVAAFKQTAAFSLGWWFNRTTGHQINGGKSAPSNTTAYILEIFEDDYIYWVVSTNGGDEEYLKSQSTTTATGWHHLLGTYDGFTNTMALYLDGVAIPTTAVGGAVPDAVHDSTAVFELGRYNLGNDSSPSGVDGRYSRGSMDGAVFYSRALTPGEVADLYAAGNNAGVEYPFGNSTTPVLSFIDLTPATVYVAASGDKQFTAAGYDQFGNSIATGTLTWSTTTGSITSGGLLTAGSVATGQFVSATASNGVVGTAAVTVRTSTLHTGLVSLWPLESNGYDVVGRNKGILSTTGLTLSAGNGIVGNGCGFDGSSGHITMADHSSLDLTTGCSIAFWYKRVSGDKVSAGKFDTGGQVSYLLQVFSDDFIYWNVSGDGSTIVYHKSNATDTSTTWNHLVGTYNGTTMVVYLNGSVLATTLTGSVPASLFNSTSAFELGKYNGANLGSGAMDEVGLWNRALSSGEVTALYNAGSGVAFPF